MTNTGEELEQLRRENAELNEQVKLLVRTEQRLYRSQRRREHELARVRALGELALDCAEPALSEADILARALRLLDEGFHVDGVRAFVCTGRTGRYVDRDGADEPEPHPPATLARWSRMGTEIRVGQDLVPEELRESLGLPELGTTAFVPLTVVDAAPVGWILAWRRAGTPGSFHRSEFHERHTPYLLLLRRHVESALRNAALTGELRENGHRLATINERLSASLANLESTQKELLQARKMEAVGRLAGGIAHDFNNLLTVILNHAETLREASPTRSDEREAALRILEAGRSAADITRQLLAFGRKEPRRPVRLELSPLVAETARMLERLLGERIRLELDLSDAPGVVRADPAQVEQIVLNLVVNARDAMPTGGTLQVRTCPAEEVPPATDAPEDPSGYFALSVSDTGEGIDDDTRARIFEPFFTTKRQGYGTGLGLAMVYGAVQQNGGHITVESVPGRGTTFTVYLPLELGPLPPAEVPAATEPTRRGATVLVVEDDVQVREVTARILERDGYGVVEAESAEDALQHMASGAAVDVVVTDVILPGESGGRLVECLRRERPELPAVFLSGYSFDELDADRLGAFDEFLQKPFTPEALRARVRHALANAEAGQPTG